MSNPYISWELKNLNNQNYTKLQNIYEYELGIEPEITDQKDTGRCWLFAALNCMRIPFIIQYNLPSNFQFSANYLFFWDKYERCKYFLTNYPSIANHKQSRVREHFLRKPIHDGGQWHMFVNLVEKYGVVPQDCFRETLASQKSSRLNTILNHKLKHAVLHNKDTTTVLDEIYKILVSYLGEPPTKITWTYRNVNGQYCKVQNVSPQMFNMFYVEPYFNVHDYTNIINDPRHKYNTYYTVDHLTNMVNTSGPMYYNLPMEKLTSYSCSALMSSTPVWFGCDVMKLTSRTHCISGSTFYEDKDQMHLSKEERLRMLDSALTHAMVLHGFSNDKTTSKPYQWKIENSWGYHGPYKGYYIADNKWFDEYVYQVIIPHKVFKPPSKMRKTKVKTLPPWDPFGSLAKRSKILRCL